jgi:hypothetical protein
VLSPLAPQLVGGIHDPAFKAFVGFSRHVWSYSPTLLNPFNT